MLFFNFFKKFDLVVLRLFNLHDRRFLHRDTAILVASEFNDYVFICNINNNSVKPLVVRTVSPTASSDNISCTLFCSFFCGLISNHQNPPIITT